MLTLDENKTGSPNQAPKSHTNATPSRRITFTLLVSLALFFVACSSPPLFSSDPNVEAARRACQDAPEIDRFTCVEQQAIATLDPEVCRLLGIAVDDACLQSVYEAADDPAICDRLYLPGVVPTCKAYYADPNRVPRLLTPAPIPTVTGGGAQ